MLTTRKVILYKHGVGYFERQGEVSGDAAIELAFKQAEMNDVLKSLTVLDLSGGSIQSISYEASQPVERQLEELALELSDDQALSGLLAQIKGARVAVEIGSRQVEGAIIGIERVVRKEDHATTTLQLLTLLVEGESLQALDLRQVKQIRLLDEPLKKDLQHLLEVLISAKKKDLKHLTIYAKGKGKRTLFASYVLEAPVWKTSYRLLLDAEKSLIQGWALIDNTQDEDWDDIALTLVAGLPISFIHDLYSPRYKQRPVVEVQEETAYAPPTLEAAGASVEVMDFGLAGAAVSLDELSEPAAAGAEPRAAVRKMTLAQARETALPVQTKTAEIGDGFQYEIQTPVTVKRNQSALVPILQAPFQGKRVAVYNPEVRENNPMSAVLFKNTTGLMLEGGPLTVSEQETYVGESMLDTLKPEEERLVPFSVELGCVITRDHSSERRNVHQVTVADGVVSLLSYQLQRTLYVINNKNDRALELFLDHRFIPGWELEQTAAPVEQTEHFYRFRFEAPATQVTRFTVTEKGQQSQSFMIANLNRNQILLWFESRYIKEATRQALEELVTLKEKASELEGQIRKSEQDIKDIFKNQERLRQNLKALGTADDEKGLRERYITELSQQEDRLSEYQHQIRQWRDEKQRLERELATKIKRFHYEGKPRDL